MDSRRLLLLLTPILGCAGGQVANDNAVARQPLRERAAPGERPTPRPSKASSRHVPVPEELSFLRGCWIYWSVDWGFSLTWKRDGDVWIGELESGGAMGPRATEELRIVRTARALVLRVDGDGRLWFDAGPAELELTHVQEGAFSFANESKAVRLEIDPAKDELLFGPFPGDDFVYELKRRCLTEEV